MSLDIELDIELCSKLALCLSNYSVRRLRGLVLDGSADFWMSNQCRYRLHVAGDQDVRWKKNLAKLFGFSLRLHERSHLYGLQHYSDVSGWAVAFYCESREFVLISNDYITGQYLQSSKQFQCWTEQLRKYNSLFLENPTTIHKLMRLSPPLSVAQFPAQPNPTSPSYKSE